MTIALYIFYQFNRLPWPSYNPHIHFLQPYTHSVLPCLQMGLLQCRDFHWSHSGYVPSQWYNSTVWLHISSNITQLSARAINASFCLTKKHTEIKHRLCHYTSKMCNVQHVLEWARLCKIHHHTVTWPPILHKFSSRAHEWAKRTFFNYSNNMNCTGKRREKGSVIIISGRGRRNIRPADGFTFWDWHSLMLHTLFELQGQSKNSIQHDGSVWV